MTASDSFLSAGRLKRQFCRPAAWHNITGLGAGTAECRLAEVSTVSEAAARIKAFRAAKLKLFVIGSGTNLIGADTASEDTVYLKPVRGGDFSVLRLVHGNRVFAGSACTPGEIVRFALRHGLGGAWGLSGIPGSLGGALAMNAGANGVAFADFVAEVRMIALYAPETREFSLPGSALAFGYRRSPVLRNRMLVTGAALEFKHVDPASEAALIRAETERRGHAPAGRSVGSIFLNPPGLNAGKLLDGASCKGLTRGAFAVSSEHANWIVRNADSPPGTGACADFRALLGEMQKRVLKTHNILLTPEVRFAGTAEQKCFRTKPWRVLVLKGGCSSEREISLQSGEAIAAALRENGYDVSEYDIRAPALVPEMTRVDLVWPVLHGGFGEDGGIQQLLETAEIPFVGSGSRACRLIMNKLESKRLMDRHGIPNARYAVLDHAHCDIPAHLKFPLVVKPVSEGSTFGLSVVESPAEWEKALDLVFRYGEQALAEEFFAGAEVTLGIVAGQTLPMIEIRCSAKVYDYDAKYLHKTCETQYLCHAPAVPDAIQEKLRAASLRFFELSGARDILRVDLMVNPATGDFIMLEGNSIPGCTANSLVPKAAEAMGLSFPDLCALLLENAAKRAGEKTPAL